MSPWPEIVIPAVLTALLVRVDGKLIGPYFALSEVIPGAGNVTAQYWYERPTLRHALARRLLYPCLTGAVMSWVSEVPTWEIGVIGLVTAGLLLWPVIFHGLPRGVSRRDWEVPVIYASFAFSYAMLAIAGSLIPGLINYVADGDMRKWLADQFLATFFAWVLVLFLVAVYRASLQRLSQKAIRRDTEESP